MSSMPTGVSKSVFGRQFIKKIPFLSSDKTPFWERSADWGGCSKANKLQTHFLEHRGQYTALKVGALFFGLLAVGSLVAIFHFCPSAHHAWTHQITPFFHTKAGIATAATVGGVALLALTLGPPLYKLSKAAYWRKQWLNYRPSM